MSMAPAKLLVSVMERLACIKIVGRANFSSSIDFKTLINELQQKGYHCYIIDLSECVLMDSTFLGVLAGFGLKMAQDSPAKNGQTIELFNPNPRISELLDNLGVLHLFKVVNGPLSLPREMAAHVPATAATPTPEELKRNCLEAHRVLMNISPDNVLKFKEVAQFLAEDLKKDKAGP
jgi:anti-anti-sigma regulatory factor